MTAVEFKSRLDTRADEILAVLARSGWRLWDGSVPRNPEQRKSLERHFTAIEEALRLDGDGRLDDGKRTRLADALDITPPDHPDAYGQRLETIDQALIALGDDCFLCALLEIEYERDRSDRGGGITTWSTLYKRKPIKASVEFFEEGAVTESSETEARNKLAVLYRTRQSLYGLHRARAGMKAMRLLYLGLVLGLLAVGVIAVVSLLADGVGPVDGLLVAFAGALGATTSAAYKLRDQIPRLSALRTFWYAFFLQVALGASAGLFLWIVLESGFVEFGSGVGGEEWAVAAAVAFAAGFSEPLLLKTVERILGSGDQDAEET
jgi:hypothetical protein